MRALSVSIVSPPQSLRDGAHPAAAESNARDIAGFDLGEIGPV